MSNKELSELKDLADKAWAIMTRNQKLEISKAECYVENQDPKRIGPIFRYPLNPVLHCDPSCFAIGEEVKDIPIIHAEFRFYGGEWVFFGIKGLQ